MKPRLTTELVPVTYWACANPTHRHKNEETAARCIEGAQARQRQPECRPHWGAAGNALVLSQYLAGSTVADLARQLDISASRVREIINAARIREERARRAASDPFFGLSVRTANCLRCDNYTTVQQVRDAVASGAIAYVEGLGKECLTEVVRWLRKLDTESKSGTTARPA